MNLYSFEVVSANVRFCWFGVSSVVQLMSLLLLFFFHFFFRFGSQFAPAVGTVFVSHSYEQTSKKAYGAQVLLLQQNTHGIASSK